MSTTVGHIAECKERLRVPSAVVKLDSYRVLQTVPRILQEFWTLNYSCKWSECLRIPEVIRVIRNPASLFGFCDCWKSFLFCFCESCKSFGFLWILHVVWVFKKVLRVFSGCLRILLEWQGSILLLQPRVLPLCLSSKWERVKCWLLERFSLRHDVQRRVREPREVNFSSMPSFNKNLHIFADLTWNFKTLIM